MRGEVLSVLDSTHHPHWCPYAVPEDRAMPRVIRARCAEVAITSPGTALVALPPPSSCVTWTGLTSTAHRRVRKGSMQSASSHNAIRQPHVLGTAHCSVLLHPLPPVLRDLRPVKAALLPLLPPLVEHDGQRKQDRARQRHADHDAGLFARRESAGRRGGRAGFETAQRSRAGHEGGARGRGCGRDGGRERHGGCRRRRRGVVHGMVGLSTHVLVDEREP
ncbi:hypothetical protein BJ546DRAFT_597628 [Cryomyces antarcticus]